MPFVLRRPSVLPLRRSPKRVAVVVRAVAVLVAALASVPSVRAQQPLFMIDENTTVRGVNFRFEDTQTFSEKELRELLATQGPNGWDRAKAVGRRIPLLGSLLWKPTVYPLDPLEVQRDVVRLRKFYRLNGFLQTRIRYPASQLDTASNTIRVIYSITEGEPLRVRRVTLTAFAPGGDTLRAFPADVQAEWRRLEDGRTSLKRGDRFSSLDYALFKGQVLDWARNRGYPFATIAADSTVDLDSLRIDLRVRMVPGPRATVDRVIVVGNTSVEDVVVRREVPVRRGDRFEQNKLLVGQRELFGLGLFRSVVADVPPQPVDSSVAIRYTVREGRPRLLTAETGYVTDEGVNVTGRWRHRNFFGGARTFEVQATWTPGLLSPPGSDAPRRLELSATLRQPYLFNRQTSGSIGPYLRRIYDPQQQTTTNALGVQAEVLRELLPFRTVSLRAVGEVDRTHLDAGLDFSRRQATLTAAARLGRLDSYLDPRSGFDLRPSVRAGLAGIAFDFPTDPRSAFPGYADRTSLPYLRPQVEALGYAVLSRKVDGAVRLVGGYLAPLGRARLDALAGGTFDATRLLLSDVYFGDLRFRAGGSSDVRGWALSRVGAQALELIESDPSLPYDPANPSTGQFRVRESYRPVGGRAKVALNSELRLPFPRLSNAWRTAVFVDAGMIDATDLRDSTLNINVVSLGARTRDRITLRRIAFDRTVRIGTGAGIRYRTPIGYLRFDLAYKVNPTLADRYTPQEYVDKFIDGETPGIDRPGAWHAVNRAWRRMQIHFGIGQTF